MIGYEDRNHRHICLTKRQISIRDLEIPRVALGSEVVPISRTVQPLRRSRPGTVPGTCQAPFPRWGFKNLFRDTFDC